MFINSSYPPQPCFDHGASPGRLFLQRRQQVVRLCTQSRSLSRQVRSVTSVPLTPADYARVLSALITVARSLEYALATLSREDEANEGKSQ
jgi:hypothetical protein